MESPHPRATDKSISTSRVPRNIELNGATVTKCEGDRIDHSVKGAFRRVSTSPLVIATYISINHQEYQPPNPKQIWQKCLLAHANKLFTMSKANGWRGQRQGVSCYCCRFCVVMMTMMNDGGHINIIMMIMQ
mmetsp:Transcript_30283/g.47404  ORF Transcript_30283/g.47404 Transcript_30283/m.47404 type:complete len:132 (+) Transcript_30283:899-1294(+)